MTDAHESSNSQALNFSGDELSPQISKDLDELLKRISDLQLLVDEWIKITPADRASMVRGDTP